MAIGNKRYLSVELAPRTPAALDSIQLLCIPSGQLVLEVDEYRDILMCFIANCHFRLSGSRDGLVVERRTPKREVGVSILTQVAVLYP